MIAHRKIQYRGLSSIVIFPHKPASVVRSRNDRLKGTKVTANGEKLDGEGSSDHVM